jgi:hypothetical protein
MIRTILWYGGNKLQAALVRVCERMASGDVSIGYAVAKIDMLYHAARLRAAGYKIPRIPCA